MTRDSLAVFNTRPSRLLATGLLLSAACVPAPISTRCAPCATQNECEVAGLSCVDGLCRTEASDCQSAHDGGADAGGVDAGVDAGLQFVASVIGAANGSVEADGGCVSLASDAGGGIDGNADGLLFFGAPVRGDFVARTSLGASTTQVVGLLVRETLAPEARIFAHYQRLGVANHRTGYRLAGGSGLIVDTSTVAVGPRPTTFWVARRGNSFTSYAEAMDGGAIALDTVTVAMGSTAFVGPFIGVMTSGSALFCRLTVQLDGGQ
jgi:hypothetical protein